MKLPIQTNDGEFIAYYSKSGLARLDFPKTQKKAARATPLEPAVPKPVAQWHKMTARALSDALAGVTPKEMPPLDTTTGTEFQQQVWAALRRISTGSTASYAEIAAKIGQPKAARAVGGACGANPIPVLVPCHRVLAANQRIGGFSGGLEWKRTLLAREAARSCF